VPRPDATPAFIAALAQPIIRPALFVQATFNTATLYLWTGRGSITWGGRTWLGVGTLGTVSTIEEGSNVEARGITLTMSGLDPTALQDVLNEVQQGLPALVYFGLFDESLALIPNPVTAFAGRMDQPTLDVTGETATISIACESRLMDMNNPAMRRYTNEDQQRDYPNDQGFSFVPGVQEVTIYWGRTPSSHNNI
jgi:hypothetical protein